MPLSDRIRRARYAEATRTGADPLAANASPSSRQLLTNLEARYNIGLWFWDYKSKTFDWDEGMRRMNGFPIDMPMPPGADIPVELISEDRWMINSVINHGLPVSSWVSVVRRDSGTESFHLCHVDVLRDERGEPDLAIGFVQDITPYNILVEQLICKNRALTDVYEQFGILSWSAVVGSKFIEATGLEELTGTPLALLEGDGLLSRVHPDDRLQLATWRMKARTTDAEKLKIALNLKTASGEYRKFDAQVSIFPAPRSDHLIEHWLCLPPIRGRPPSRQPDMTPKMLRTARSALGWTVQDLSRSSGVSVATITRYERGSSLREMNCERLVTALSAAGVMVSTSAGGGFYLEFNPVA